MKPKGEAIPFGVFGGISFIGLLLSFGIRGEKLEDGEWTEEDEEEVSSEEGDGEAGEAGRNDGGEQRPLVGGRGK